MGEGENTPAGSLSETGGIDEDSEFVVRGSRNFEFRTSDRPCRARRARRAREKLADFFSILLEEGGHDEVDNVGGTFRALLEIEHGGNGKELSLREIYGQASPAVGVVMGYADGGRRGVTEPVRSFSQTD